VSDLSVGQLAVVVEPVDRFEGDRRYSLRPGAVVRVESVGNGGFRGIEYTVGEAWGDRFHHVPASSLRAKGRHER
jgi:hypothetical protein